MAVRNVLGGHHLGTRIQPKSTRNKKPADKCDQTKPASKYESLQTAASRTLPNFSLIPQVPLYDAYEISKISEANVWWNYASREEMLKLYGLAMDESGKTLKSFSLKSLVEFIEKSLCYSNDGDSEEHGGITFFEIHKTIVFNTEKNCVDYRLSACCQVGEYYEDVTSPWYQSMKGLNKTEKLMRWKYMMLLYKLTPIDSIYHMEMGSYFKETDVDEFIEHITEYLDLNDEESLEDYRKNFLKAKRYVKSKTYLRKKQVFAEIYKLDIETLFDHVIAWLESVRHKTTIPDIDKRLEAVKRICQHRKKYEDLIAVASNYGMSPMCLSLFCELSPNDAHLGIVHLKAVEMDLQNSHENSIDFEYSLLENIDYKPEDYLNDLATIL